MNDERSGPKLPNRPRRALRIPAHDYSLAGGYFVTICTRDRICCLGSVVDEKIDLSPAGQIVEDVWNSLPARLLVVPDQFVVMPNHVHAVIQLVKEGTTLGEVVRAFKAASARLIRQGPLPEFAWQANYYEHIIRNEHELQRIRDYIFANPAMWENDPENPGRMGSARSSADEAPWAR